ncbi:MAG: BrnA antitoxin family protein [Acidobacteriota bacterium]
MKKRSKSKSVTVELRPGQSLTTRQRRELRALAARPDKAIDTTDIPELPAGAWKNAVRGRWYRPLKQPVSIRLDADVLAWLKAGGSGYQTRVNTLLREKMIEDLSR